MGELSLQWLTEYEGPAPRTVIATGVFDVLHVGHLRFLEAARAAGQRLIVGLEDDERTRARKGAGRPVVGLPERAAMIAGLRPVTAVFGISGAPESANAPGYAELLGPLEPAVLALTEGDRAEAGKRLVADWLGASVLVVPRVEGRSTTLLIEHLIASADVPSPLA